VGFPEAEPFVEQLSGNAIEITDLLNGVKSGEMFPQNPQDKQQTVSGVWDDDVGKNGVRVTATLARDTVDAQICFFPVSAGKVDNGSAVVGMDTAVPTRTAAGTGLKLRSKTGHVRVKKRF
jgi:hypothetical protein